MSTLAAISFLLLSCSKLQNELQPVKLKRRRRYIKTLSFRFVFSSTYVDVFIEKIKTDIYKEEMWVYIPASSKICSFKQLKHNLALDRLLKRHGRWKSDRAKDGYIEDSLESLSKNWTWHSPILLVTREHGSSGRKLSISFITQLFTKINKVISVWAKRIRK